MRVANTPPSECNSFGTLEGKIKTLQYFCLRNKKEEKPCFYAGFSDKDLKINWPQALSANTNSLSAALETTYCSTWAPRGGMSPAAVGFSFFCPWVSQNPQKLPLCPQPLHARYLPARSMSTVDHLPCSHLFSGAFL